MTFKLPLLLPLLCIVSALLVSACGNKGDLFVLPDEITQQDLLQLEQALQAEDAPTDGPDAGKNDEDEVGKDKTQNPLSR